MIEAVRHPSHRGRYALPNIKIFLADQDGATAIEYAMVASIICLAIFTVVGTIGTKLSPIFSNVSTNI